jgi:beta-N-acetylhexosaminidase
VRIRVCTTAAAAAVLASALLVTGCSAEPGSTGQASGSAAGSSATSPQPLTISSQNPSAEQGSRADQCDASALLRQLSTRQKLAQLINVGVTGKADALNMVRTEQIGGIFVTSWADPQFLASRGVQEVAAASPLPLMVTIDEEGGRVSRAKGVLGPMPSARVMAQTMSVDEVYQLARERGEGLRSYGITVDFAPVVDITDRPDDDVVGDRAFGADAATVIAYAGAFARGLSDAGVMPVLKHFPGHGSASGDSHLGAVVAPPLNELQDKDLEPYRELVGSAPAVMVGHMAVPGLTQPGTPASLSPEVMALLRDGAGYDAPPFNGLIFTDDLGSMQAITDSYDITEAVLQSLRAGADIALWISTDRVSDVLDRLEAAVASGELPLAQVEESVVRVARAKGIADC